MVALEGRFIYTNSAGTGKISHYLGLHCSSKYLLLKSVDHLVKCQYKTRHMQRAINTMSHTGTDYTKLK